MRVLLLYNLSAGRGRSRRAQLVQAAAEALRRHGFDVELIATAATQEDRRRQLAAGVHGTAGLFACGGDGTIHEALQVTAQMGLVLGILPAGSQNALARELRIPLNPITAARAFRPDSFREVPLSTLTRASAPARYFLCMAGAGPAGALMYRMLTASKSRWGRLRYYEQALRCFATQRFPEFDVEVITSSGESLRRRIVSAMALRIGDLGGLFTGAARTGRLDDHLHVVLVSGPALLHLPLWLACSWLGLQRLHPGVSVVEARSLHIVGTGIPLQVDGEWAGYSPATMAMLESTQRIFVPVPSDERGEAQ